MRKAPIGYCWILFNDSHSWHGIFRRGIFHRTNVQSRQRCLSRRAAMETNFVCCGFRPFRPGREHLRETARQSLCRNRVAKSGIGVKAAIFELEIGFSRAGFAKRRFMPGRLNWICFSDAPESCAASRTSELPNCGKHPECRPTTHVLLAYPANSKVVRVFGESFDPTLRMPAPNRRCHVSDGCSATA